ncbi:hypothetical protein KFL_004010015 [Klebsormidium nitens]|uniref:CCHC-type domain-containing protein n=1 Tax=Klebsormidium nitens TaxID=105231 RepID=A0A1Y1IF78_KLENI|nr:hypothetical protein KFL_004010015 [Klebsormidium nitens]|eukprot:GAQ88109.1 hypothetical protein KFL_004010015 [Klebsormidium nitens]
MDGAAGLREGETEKEGDDEGGSVSEKEGDTVIALRKESGKEAQNESGEKVGGQGQKARATAAKGSRPMEEPTRGTQGKEELTRGKRAKLKKARDKYAEQDEEEREIRMALLASAGKSDKGTGKGGKKGGKDARGKGGEPEKMKRESAGPVQDERKVCYKCKQAGHVAKDCPTGEVSGAALSGTADSATAEPANGKAGRIGQSEGDKREAEGPEGARATDEVSAEKGSDGTQLSRRARARAQNEGERAEIAAILEEENLQELPDEERDRLTELDALTGVPRADDILLYAVPMCGPYTALQGCKFKVKLTPGTAKKGKAAKTAVEVFSRMPEATRREKELMKAVQDPDLVAVMLGNAKVTAPGLTKMKQTQKKGRKASAQKQ